MSEISDLVLDTANRLFEGYTTPAVLKESEKGTWPEELWRTIEGAALELALVPEAAGGPGMEVGEGLEILKSAEIHQLVE